MRSAWLLTNEFTVAVTHTAATPYRTTADCATWRCIWRPSIATGGSLHRERELSAFVACTAPRGECGHGHHAEERAVRTASRRAALRTGFSRNATAPASSDRRRVSSSA